MDRYRLPLTVCALAAIALLLASCAATQPQLVSHAGGVPGFWKGLWHGFIAPPSRRFSFLPSRIRTSYIGRKAR